MTMQLPGAGGFNLQKKPQANQEELVLERIARLTYAGVSDAEIANVVNLSPGRISQIKEEEKYKEWYSRIVTEKFEDKQETDDSWDRIERKATKVVSDHLEWTHDPDFALKAAMVANKAQRRNVLNTPISADAGARVIIQLGHNYVTKLQSGNGDRGTVINHKEHEKSDQKEIDIATPKAVEEMLGVNRAKENVTIIEQQLKDAGFNFGGGNEE